MKIRLLYLLFGALLCTVLFLNNSGGAANVQRIDRTGSPLSPATCANPGCHSSGSFSPSISAQLLKDGMTVNAYEPGEDYTLRIQISASGSPTRYGFQTVALMGMNDQNSGTFDSEPAGFNKVTLNNRVYVEHNSPRPANTLEIKWEAPASGSGAVRFYAAGIAANGNGSSSGDGTASLANPLTIGEASVSSVFGVDALAANLDVYPNPVAERLNLRIQIQESGRYFLQIFDTNGRKVQQRTLQLQAGENLETFDMSELAAGNYFVNLSDGNRVVSKKILKK